MTIVTAIRDGQPTNLRSLSYEVVQALGVPDELAQRFM
ncbi:hypothetical protein J2Z21_009385 [Streptomyces griseochromogenes]|uniref:Uncharacterized protein n=1 Tax=Streptomyces griseochromogenes TaxID=68214 RepID=A0ABS4M9L2_9ACTN|nr:hypothetical protein [Streptomyces griseochromogenes]